MSWKTFKKVADAIYDESFGWAEVNTRLKVVGDGWWLDRWEYDGSEGWAWNEPPLPTNHVVSTDKANNLVWAGETF
jgi:hypothetical protein